LWRSYAKLRASMWHCGVDVAYRRLSDWTSLQWALHTQRLGVHSLPWLFTNYFGFLVSVAIPSV